VVDTSWRGHDRESTARKKMKTISARANERLVPMGMSLIVCLVVVEKNQKKTRRVHTNNTKSVTKNPIENASFDSDAVLHIANTLVFVSNNAVLLLPL
jgi:hypothetical protein